ncbi:hypothetical protein CLV78_11829 [Aliiruegeria haliotis]|uniref:Uncharacterized protein n=1 Tax=Aliiruegeria haliotis TaxID=1280846 RepID=A0A2T0RF09_9RHOB|nr:hypothetical protein [Aliiruegeria haliotis]PRY19786.1 hypothetical protein CLV78_11829 [Aliiruegeria haliotis]
MFKTKYFATVALAGLFAGQVAMASDVLPSTDSTFRMWGEEGDWKVMVDEGRNTCLTERVFENGGVIQMGLTKDHEFGYFGVFTKDADVKKKQEIILSLGGNLYSADARGKTKNLADGYVGGYLLTDNPNFVDDVMNQKEMIVYPEETYAWIVSLDGTKKAIEAARKCNMEAGG